MTPPTIIGLISNAALLLGLGMLYDILALRKIQERTNFHQAITGCLLGVIGITIMSNPWEFAPGVIFDSRSILMCVAGFFFGAVPTAFAALIIGCYRLWLGGAGAWVGVAVITTSGLVGLIWRYKRKNKFEDVTIKEMYVLGIITHTFMLLWMLALPWPIAKGVLSKITFPVLLIFPVGTALLGQLMLSRHTDKLAKAALKESEEKFRGFSEQSLVGIYLIQDGYFVYANSKFADIFGYTINECLDNMHFQKLVHPQDFALVDEQIRKRVTGEIPFAQYEFRGIKKNGDIVHVEIYGSLNHYKGSPAAAGTVLDITERRLAIDSLRESKERYRTLLDSNPDPVVVYDQQGSVIYFNQAFTAVFGWSLDECIGNTMDMLIPKKNKQETNSMIEKIKAGESFSGFETCCYTKSGDRVAVSISASVYKDSEDNPIGNIVNIRDITSQKRIEARLQQAEKMEIVGTLAGGVAHDFNNILFPLIGYAEMLKEDIPLNERMQRHVDEILRAAFRARDLVKQILTFSRQEHQEMRPMKLQPIIKEALKLLRSSIPTTIDIRQDIDSDCSIVIADSTQIHQIVMNLATNAYHAMEDNGGILSISLKQVRLKSDQLLSQELEPGEYALLTVADTGIGIEKEVMNKIFDPYFTTKEVHKGTGLGLSVVQGVIKQSNGDILIKSEPGKGTEIQVYLPIRERTVDRVNTKPIKPVQGGTETILLVDDEDAVIRMEQSMLERLGYQVVSRTSSIEALEAFKHDPAKFDLIITDMTMPNMTGVQLAGATQKIRSDIPVILCTGFSDHINDEKAKSMGIQAFVMKPVIKGELANKMRDVLDNGKVELHLT